MLRFFVCHVCFFVMSYFKFLKHHLLKHIKKQVFKIFQIEKFPNQNFSIIIRSKILGLQLIFKKLSYFIFKYIFQYYSQLCINQNKLLIFFFTRRFKIHFMLFSSSKINLYLFIFIQLRMVSKSIKNLQEKTFGNLLKLICKV